jgi:hypothetical protein
MRMLVRLVGSLLLISLMVPFTVAAQPDDDLEDRGFVDDTTWESPAFGTEITWDRPWEADTDATTVADDGEHLPLLGDGYYLDVYLFAAFEETVPQYTERLIDLRVEDWKDGDFALIALEGDDEEWSAFAYTFEDQGVSWIGLIEITLVDDAFLTVQFVTPLDDLDDAFETTMDTVEVDGDAPFVHHWDARSLPDGDEDPIDVGSGDDGTDPEVLWEGELHGAAVACTDAWTADDASAWIDEENDVESVSIMGPNGTLILTFASAADSDLEFVMDVQRDVIEGQWEWVDLEEVDTGGDDATAWAGFTGDINDVPQMMIVEAGWYDLDDETVAIVQFISNADTFEDGFDEVYSECTIDGYFPFTHYAPATIDEFLDAA